MLAALIIEIDYLIDRKVTARMHRSGECLEWIDEWWGISVEISLRLLEHGQWQFPKKIFFHFRAKIKSPTHADVPLSPEINQKLKRNYSPYFLLQMQQKFVLSIALFMTCNVLYAQNIVDSLLTVGNNRYRKNDFSSAAQIWEKAAQLTQNKLAKNMHYAYAASAYASAMDSTNSFKCLDIAITQLGFNDLPALTSDGAYLFMQESARWKNLINSIKPTYSSNPEDIKIIDTDVINFWKAYDLVQKNPALAEKIYTEHYINPGSMALQYYYLYKIDNINNFVYIHNLKKKYYESIRKNTFKASKYKSTFKKSFINLKKIYPQAIFPPIYFVIGKLNSAGTSSSEGLILALDQASMSPEINISELNTWEKNNISTLKNLPYTVAHELIHFEQDGLAYDTTLLSAALKEGMADFIGELISGKSSNTRLLKFAKGKEKSIWADFKKEMYLDRAYNWIANSDQETDQKPADLGYWVGYQICKAYYEQASDKQKAIYEMLHIQDYKKFLATSKLDEKFR